MTLLKNDDATNSRQTSINLFELIFFHARRCRDSLLFTISINFVDIEMWSELWFISNLIMQWMNFCCSFFVMNIKSIVLWKWRVFQIIMFTNKANRNWTCWTTFKNWFVASCWINLVASLHSEWCRLKFLKKICFSSSFKRFWRSQWSLMNCVTHKNRTTHCKRCARWFIFRLRFWFEWCIHHRKRNQQINDRHVYACWRKSRFSRFRYLHKADESRCWTSYKTSKRKRCVMIFELLINHISLFVNRSKMTSLCFFFHFWCCIVKL